MEDEDEYSHRTNRFPIIAKQAIKDLESWPQRLEDDDRANGELQSVFQRYYTNYYTAMEAELVRWTKELERQMPLDLNAAAATLPRGIMLLSHIFFGSKIGPSLVRIQFDQVIVKNGEMGRTTGEGDDYGTRWCTIKLATHYDAAGDGEMLSTEDLVGTMLHELRHVYLHLWGCSCEVCGMEWERSNGHEQGWKMLARAVEKKARQLLAMPVALNVKENAEYWARKVRRFLKNQHKGECSY